MKETKVGPDAVDKLVGERVRFLRKERGISQAKLAESIGVSFQQVQKYELAKNRMSISMLTRVAETLDTTVGDVIGEHDDGRRNFEDIAELMNQHGVLELVRAFSRLPEGPQRRAIINLVVAVADGD